jgi:hypothetical protein
LIALLDSNQAHLFEALQGRLDPVRDLEREDADEDIQRDKPRFTYKKRFTATGHERLHDDADAPFLREVAGAIAEASKNRNFAGLILLGQSQDTAALRTRLPKQLDALVVGEAPQAMTVRLDDLAENVDHHLFDCQTEHQRQLLAELTERWKRNHLVANGATEVLDALQQGRAIQVLFGTRRDMPGARCRDCRYRFGAPVAVCPYCQGRCAQVSAAQDILGPAMRHRVPVEFLRMPAQSDPLEPAGGVVALLRAAANWAPNAELAQASEGHAQAV